MSEPLKLRMVEEQPVEVPPPLEVLPNPQAPAASAPQGPPPLSAEPPVPAVSSRTSGNFLSPEEVDVVAGFKEQEALEAATESHWKGFAGGALAALVCTLVAGGFSALSGRWYGFLSMGIGFAVAYAVRKLGKGNSPQFGLIGATWSLLGCLGAYHLASAIVMARADGVSLFEFISGIQSWGGFMQDVLGPKDFVFYAIAAYFGYKRSYDAVADRY
jgi:hypothetical protein